MLNLGFHNEVQLSMCRLRLTVALLAESIVYQMCINLYLYVYIGSFLSFVRRSVVHARVFS